MLPADLLTRYGLPEDEALKAIEYVVTRTLTNAFRTHLSVRVNSLLEITSFPRSGAPFEITKEAVSRKLRRHLVYMVELELQKRQALFEAVGLIDLRRKCIAGEISRIAADGTLCITFEIAELFTHLAISGECPVRHQPPAERDRYRVGEVREFLVTSVVPIIVNKRSARVRIRLSRASKEFPARLLTERTGIAGIECRRRILGGFSDIVTPARLPKEAINSVGKELGEHLNVFVAKASNR
ncbi:MAG TPA: hypothetical protein VI298_15700 [Geobacteraceae bacterium]